jgi:hypothetical protein
MVWLLPIWFCLLLMTIGCGLLAVSAVQRLGGESFRTPLSIFQLFWFGYAFLIAALQLASTLLPVRWPLTAALMVCSALGFVVARQAVRRRLRSLWARRSFTLSLLLCGVITVLVVAGRAAQQVGWYDTHLYHLQVVKWARTYPAVPGIANLHYRLAFDNSVHLFGALTDVFYKGRASHLANGFLCIMVTLQLLAKTLRPGHQRARLIAAFCILVLPFVLGRIASNEVASLSSDLPLNLMCIVLVLELLASTGAGPRASKTSSKTWRSRGTRQDLTLALVLTLSTVAVTTKLGGLGMLVVTGLYALGALVERDRSKRLGLSPRAGWKRRALAMGALPALLLCGYFARQTILSGWLFFPAPIGNLHLSWSLPEAETLDQFRWIQSWARLPGREPADVLDQGFMRWFEPWFDRVRNSQEFQVMALALALALVRLAQPRAARLPWQAIALSATILSIVLWFKGAPDLRFGAGFFWLLLAVIGAPMLGQLLQERSGQLLGLVLGLALSIWTGGLSAELAYKGYWTKLPPVGKPALIERELSPGLKAWVTDPSADICGNEPLPCTPYPVHQRLRRPGDLSAGFLF